MVCCQYELYTISTLFCSSPLKTNIHTYCGLFLSGFLFLFEFLAALIYSSNNSLYMKVTAVEHLYCFSVSICCFTAWLLTTKVGFIIEHPPTHTHTHSNISVITLHKISEWITSGLDALWYNIWPKLRLAVLDSKSYLHYNTIYTLWNIFPHNYIAGSISLAWRSKPFNFIWYRWVDLHTHTHAASDVMT